MSDDQQKEGSYEARASSLPISEEDFLGEEGAAFASSSSSSSSFDEETGATTIGGDTVDWAKIGISEQIEAATQRRRRIEDEDSEDEGTSSNPQHQQHQHAKNRHDEDDEAKRKSPFVAVPGIQQQQRLASRVLTWRNVDATVQAGHIESLCHALLGPERAARRPIAGIKRVLRSIELQVPGGPRPDASSNAKMAEQCTEQGTEHHHDAVTTMTTQSPSPQQSPPPLKRLRVDAKKDEIEVTFLHSKDAAAVLQAMNNGTVNGRPVFVQFN